MSTRSVLVTWIENHSDSISSQNRLLNPEVCKSTKSRAFCSSSSLSNCRAQWWWQSTEEGDSSCVTGPSRGDPRIAVSVTLTDATIGKRLFTREIHQLEIIPVIMECVAFDEQLFRWELRGLVWTLRFHSLWKHKGALALFSHSSDLSQTTQVWQLSHSSL